MLEAGDRVGGRVWSERLANGSIIERGAEFVLPGYETMRDLAARLGLTFREKGTLYGDREPRDGPPVTRDELLAAVAELRDAHGATLAEAIDNLPATEGARSAIASRLAISTAHELDDQPASILADGAAGFGAFPSHGIDGGNDRLARGLAASLDVRLGRRVEQVVWSDDGVTRRRRAAEACVVATPAHAVRVRPAATRVEAARARRGSLRRGGEALPAARARGRAERDAVGYRAVSGRGPSTARLPSRRSPALAPRSRALDIANGPERWAAAVRLLRPELPFADAEPVLATWPGGAYSARSLSSPLDDEALARTVGPIAFAGEHTAGEWHGLMEGALRSGLRAAAQCLDGSVWVRRTTVRATPALRDGVEQAHARVLELRLQVAEARHARAARLQPLQVPPPLLDLVEESGDLQLMFAAARDGGRHAASLTGRDSEGRSSVTGAGAGVRSSAPVSAAPRTRSPVRT